MKKQKNNDEFNWNRASIPAILAAVTWLVFHVQIVTVSLLINTTFDGFLSGVLNVVLLGVIYTVVIYLFENIIYSTKKG